MFRSFAAVIAVAVAAAPLVADDKKDEKIDAAKLVGKWKLTKSKSFPPGASAVVEFTKAGELKLAMTIEKMELKLDGTYKVNGSKMDTVIKEPGGEEQKESMELVKLTDTALHTKDEKGDVDEFERVKEEKKEEKKDK